MYKVVCLNKGSYRPVATLPEEFECYEMAKLFADDENSKLADPEDCRWIVVEVEPAE